MIPEQPERFPGSASRVRCASRRWRRRTAACTASTRRARGPARPTSMCRASSRRLRRRICAVSALTILDANILGLSCSRVCPVDVLCEGSCVMHATTRSRSRSAGCSATRWRTTRGVGFRLARVRDDAGSKVACVGGGPASLACAAELRRHGAAVTVFDNRPLPGRTQYLRRGGVQAAAQRQSARGGNGARAGGGVPPGGGGRHGHARPTGAASSTSSSSGWAGRHGAARHSGRRSARACIDALALHRALQDAARF